MSDPSGGFREADPPNGQTTNERLIEALLPEFDREMTTTRKVLERVPNESLASEAARQSFSLGELASHVAALPTFATETLDESGVREIGNLRPPVALPSRTDVLAAFDADTGAARAALAGKSDAEAHGDLDAEAERDAALLDAEGGGAPFVGPEPCDSPSRPVVGVSPAA